MSDFKNQDAFTRWQASVDELLARCESRNKQYERAITALQDQCDVLARALAKLETRVVGL